MRRGGRVDMMGVTEYRIGRSSALCWCLQTWTAVSPPVCFGWKRRLTADTQMNISQLLLANEGLQGADKAHPAKD
ncbi:uncharacterized protein LOC143418413 isoform X2 [Maylandia zebra]|uniref:uncharacterized protein LOC143418413 isoform X2 n=1 Tax=Maylandia zebra TaxID=106582 RepID=UPI00403C5E39